MTIAVHISHRKGENINHNFHFSCFTRVAAEEPDHHFIFIFDTAPDPELYLDSNCTPVILPPALKNNLLRQFWYNFKVPYTLKKYNADYFVTSDALCSLRTNVPQCMLIARHSQVDGYKKRGFRKFAAKADSIIINDPQFAEDYFT